MWKHNVGRLYQIILVLFVGISKVMLLKKTLHNWVCTCYYAVSFAGLGFLAWYLSGKIKVFDRRGHSAKLCIAFLPLLCAALVGISRVDDYWHHWQDVFAGGLIGLLLNA